MSKCGVHKRQEIHQVAIATTDSINPGGVAGHCSELEHPDGSDRTLEKPHPPASIPDCGEATAKHQRRSRRDWIVMSPGSGTSHRKRGPALRMVAVIVEGAGRVVTGPWKQE